MGFQHLEALFGLKYQILLWDICWKIHHSHFLWQFLNFLSKTHFYWSYITTNYLHRLEVIHITTLEPAYWNILTQFAKNIKFSSEISVENMFKRLWTESRHFEAKDSIQYSKKPNKHSFCTEFVNRQAEHMHWNCALLTHRTIVLNRKILFIGPLY